MAQQIPPELEQELMRYDNLRRQYETLQVAVQSMKTELTEISTTLEELGKTPDDTVTYKIVGQVMFRVDRSKLIEDLEDRKRTTEIGLESYKKKLEASAEKLRELQTKIQGELGKLGVK
ncbi:MAG: prefoldin subunit beta [Candidatus Thorarchaeota archaeon]|nr:MAG: prefoldin subunit beta [Candidatus Thorarchaeota archaeon]RLI62651.1 MAG: prefoldin subunit beta [Candidatus Thorarchaeota archaeon]